MDGRIEFVFPEIVATRHPSLLESLEFEKLRVRHPPKDLKLGVIHLDTKRSTNQRDISKLDFKLLLMVNVHL